MPFTISILNPQATIALVCPKCKTLYNVRPSQNDMIICEDYKWVIQTYCYKCVMNG